MKYKPTIGLEIHAELKTRTKMFCNSKNDPDEKVPNTNVCPICMGHPGTLPVINKEAVRHILRLGLAVNGTIADFTEFDRKNYFYPDLPKGYQISQYKFPLVRGGTLNDIQLTRVHLEEDTARSQHLPEVGEEGTYSLVDFNRAGVPLMELVTEPVITNAKDAAAFARELQLLLRYLGAGEANMEKGEMRVEANISVSAEKRLGTKVEIKNLNSFRSVEKAIAFEIERHAAVLLRGEKIVQETRGWDEVRQMTYSQRLKEESHDYRYLPDPDLPKLYISEIKEFSKATLQKNMPELPSEKRGRYERDLGIKKEDAQVFVEEESLRKLFEETIAFHPEDKRYAQTAANYITSDLVGLMRISDENTLHNVTPEAFSKLISMTRAGEISSRGAKDILSILYSDGGDPKTIAEAHSLFQKSDISELKILVQKVIEENASVAEEYRKGKEASLNFLLGQAMKKSKGSANPTLLRKILQEKI